MFTISTGHDALSSLVQTYFNHHEVAMGSGVKALATAEGRTFGYHTGVVDGVWEMLNEQRSRHYADYLSQPNSRGMIPAVERSEISDILRAGCDKYKEAKGTEDRRGFVAASAQLLRDLVCENDIDEAVEKVRRRRVLDGELPPVIGDEAWLNEERESLANVTAPYDKALAALKGN